MNCSGTVNCFGATTSTGTRGRHSSSTANGGLSTANSSTTLAYPAVNGWNFATGIGTVNAANLVNNF